MKLIKTILIIFAVAAAALLALMIHLDSPANPRGGKVKILINDGEHARDIALRLEQKGIIRNRYYFLFVAERSKRTGSLKAGVFQLSPAMSTRAVLEYLATNTGKQRTYRVTIPEGFTARQIAERLDSSGICASEKFMDIVNSPARHGIRADRFDMENLEGYLFPETYFMDDKTTCEDMAKRMVEQFLKIFSSRYERRASDLGFTVQEIVTLSSLIEKEAKKDMDRALISGVLQNRLSKKMRLQCDATIQYALPDRQQKIYYKHLKIDSPYNTYLHSGLPPGPICNPGKESIEAALYPEKTDYYYYVARSDGSHIFSRSNEEHVRAKIRIKNEMRNR